jgi:hypothetical protein
VTYILTGSLGEKQDAFTANALHEVAINDYNALYLSLSATADTLTVTVYDVAEDGTASVVDTVEKQITVCADGQHSFNVHLEAGRIVCSICDYGMKQSEFTGPAFLGTTLLGFRDGKLATGWQEFDGKTYYFTNPAAVNGTVEIDGYTYTFVNYVLTVGAWFERDGKTMLKWAGVTQRDAWVTMEGKTYYFDADGAMVRGVVQVPVILEDGDVDLQYNRFDENGVLIGVLEDGLYVSDDLIIYTIDGHPQHVGLVMSEDGSFYYINSSGEAVRNVTRYISEAWNNGLLPACHYSFGADGKMIDPPSDDE